MSLKIFQLFKIINPPLFSSPFDKGGVRGILICFYYSEKENKKVYIKTYKIKTKKIMNLLE
jgi:hypothetical protein